MSTRYYRPKYTHGEEPAFVNENLTAPDSPDRAGAQQDLGVVGVDQALTGIYQTGDPLAPQAGLTNRHVQAPGAAPTGGYEHDQPTADDPLYDDKAWMRD